MSKLRALLALSSETPADLVAPVEAALQLELEVARLDLGRVVTAAGARGTLERVVKTVVTRGEGGERRLQRELDTTMPDVVVALDPAAAAALVRERERPGNVRPVPVVAVVPELAPRAAWASEVDRWAAIDDDAAVALGEHGVEGARVHVVGPVARHAWARAGREARAALRARFKLPADEAVVLVDCARVGAEVVSQLALQLSLLGRPPAVLFDAGDDTDAAALLRRQVPPLGLRAKLFGEIPDAPLLWRAADVVLGRPRPRALLQALAAGAAFVALEPQGEREAAEARALEERGVGRTAGRVLLLAAALEPLLGGARAAAVKAAEARRAGEGGADAAEAIAKLAAEVAARREEVLAETRAAIAERAAERAAASQAEVEAEVRSARPPGELEDLGGDDDLGVPPAGAGPAMPDVRARRLAEIARDEARVRKEMADARVEAERWEQRRTLAEQKGQKGLAADAGREAERKRARMHTCLEELARLHAEKQRLEAGAPPPASAAPPPPAAGPSLDDQIAAMKADAARRGKTVDDELAALKRKMQSEKKK